MDSKTKPITSSLLQHLFSARRHHRFAFATTAPSFPRQPEGRPRPRSGPWGRDPRPAPTPAPASPGPSARGGGRPGCQGNGRTPGSSPHRLRPQKGRPQPRKAASREEEEEGLVKGGETRKKEEEEEHRKAARAIDGLLLRPGLVCLPRPSAPPGERGQTRQVTAGLGPALLYWSSCEVWGEGGGRPLLPTKTILQGNQA